MPTKPQIIAIQSAKRWLMHNRAFTDAGYRMLLWNVAKKRSCTELGNSAVEDVMAVMEDMGAQQHPRGKTYWRDTVQRRASGESSRNQVWAIHAAAALLGIDARGFCFRMSNHRTRDPEALDAREAYNVLEALKAMIQRRTGEHLTSLEDAPASLPAAPAPRTPALVTEDVDELPF